MNKASIGCIQKGVCSVMGQIGDRCRIGGVRDVDNLDSAFTKRTCKEVVPLGIERTNIVQKEVGSIYQLCYRGKIIGVGNVYYLNPIVISGRIIEVVPLNK